MENTYLQIGINKEILHSILTTINDGLEDKFAEQVEKDTGGKITKEDFHEWFAEFDVDKILFNC